MRRIELKLTPKTYSTFFKESKLRPWVLLIFFTNHTTLMLTLWVNQDLLNVHSHMEIM